MSTEQIHNLTKKRWFILVNCCIVALFSGCMYSWSVLAVPMAQELGVDSLSIVFSIANTVGFITMIIGGLLNDKYGPRWVMFAGGVMLGGGMFLSGFAQSTFHLIITYGLILGLGLSFVYGCCISNTIKFFPDHKGLVGGLVTGVYGMSSVIIAQVANLLNTACGVRASFKILGASFAVVICIGSLLNQRCPDGFMPEGYTPKNIAVNTSGRDMKPLEIIKTRVFWVLFFLLTLGAFSGMMIISNCRALATDIIGASPALAATYVSVLCFFNTAGRLGSGIMSDKFGRINTLTGAMGIGIVGMILLFISGNSNSVPVFSVGIVFVGFCFGTFMGVFPGFSTECFGAKYNTVNYGLLWIGFSFSGFFGPLLLTNLTAKTGSYGTSFILGAVIIVLGIVCSFFYRSIAKRSA